MPHTTRGRGRLVCCAIAVACALVGQGSAAGTAQPSPAPTGALRVNVTGGPAPVATLRLAIATAVRAALPEARNAEITVLSTTPPASPLDVDANTTVRATVAISAPPRPRQVRMLPVTLVNEIAPWSDAQVLLVSNSPETLPFGKVLYNGSLASGQVARLLYHHQNGSTTQRMTITVALSNPTRSAITLWVNGTGAGPTTTELASGHAAARGFLEQYWRHAGFFVEIPANTTLPLLVQDLPPRGIVSGIAQLALVDGERLNLQVVARLAGEMDPPTESYTPDFDSSHQRGAFARPEVWRSLAFVVGGPPLVMTLGADGDLLQGASGAKLAGNYGVAYAFTVQVTNPTPGRAAVSLVMHADGGQAQGTFFIGQQIVDGPVVEPGAPKVVTTIRLAPQTSRAVRISTMPEGGSNYPVHLVLTSSP